MSVAHPSGSRDPGRFEGNAEDAFTARGWVYGEYVTTALLRFFPDEWGPNMDRRYALTRALSWARRTMPMVANERGTVYRNGRPVVTVWGPR